MSVRLSLVLCCLPSLLSAVELQDGGAMGRWFMPMILERPSVRAAASWGGEGSAAVHGQDATLARTGGFADVAGRVWRDDHSEAWLRSSATQVNLSGDARLPVSGPLPERLADVRVGGFYRTIHEGRIYGGDVEVSSPSDHPYAQSRLINVAATGFASWPATDKDSWQAGLRYERISTFASGIPLPFVSYTWNRPEVGLRATLGIPLAYAEWRWTDDWSIGGGYFPVDRVQTALSWSPGTPRTKMGPPGPWTVKAGGAITYENWLLADQGDPEDRLVFRSVRAFLSGEWRFFYGNSVRLTGGRIFQRDVYLNDSASSRGDDRLRTDPAWYGSLALNLGY